MPRETIPTDSNKLNELTECIDKLGTEREMSKDATLKYQRIGKQYPEKFLEFISIIIGFRLDPHESEIYQEAMKMKEKVSKLNNGEFDCIVMFDIMLEEETRDAE